VALFSFSKLTAQITFDNAYYNSTGSNLYLTKLHVSGYKYVNGDLPNMKIYIYNTNHSLFKTISIPTLPDPPSGLALFVSENLFDLDNLVEYIVITYGNNKYRLYVIKENGTILMQRDSATISFSNNSTGTLQNRDGIFFDGTNTKMRLDIQGIVPVKTEIYTLPGTLLCAQCNENGTVNGMPVLPSGTGNNGTALFYPNPVTDQLKLKYTLPAGYKTAEINIYDLQGKLIENFKVTDTFDFIYLPTDYNNGMYLYTLVVDGKALKTEKVLLNK